MSTTELIFNNTKFYPMNENTDGSISFNGQNYAIGNTESDIFVLSEQAEATKGKYDFFLASSTKLDKGSTPTVNDLINKGKKIRLIIIGTTNDGSIETDVIPTIDLSKPDSNGHFHDVAADTYCWLSNGNFLITCDGLNPIVANYPNWFLQIFYSDAS